MLYSQESGWYAPEDPVPGMGEYRRLREAADCLIEATGRHHTLVVEAGPDCTWRLRVQDTERDELVDLPASAALIQTGFDKLAARPPTSGEMLAALERAIQAGRDESYLASPDDYVGFQIAERAVTRALDTVRYEMLAALDIQGDTGTPAGPPGAERACRPR